ncbi:type II toxin-antitoxin system prevent-host-death family antitoxin [Patescibacteria group bacterium]|nr:type II toxin-antitoxin system prevent-host-death family antitoxin [Patescibacteria group bacterium]MBU2260075.1 type II toxin-antitoxin system prevent-host-death family antitoxin [Patescibacteria group bacterium]
MTTVSYSDFRRNLAHFLNSAEEDCDEIIVSRGKRRKAIILSLDEYLSLQETAYLLSPQKNRKHLERSLREAEAGKTINVTL